MTDCIICSNAAVVLLTYKDAMSQKRELEARCRECAKPVVASDSNEVFEAKPLDTEEDEDPLGRDAYHGDTYQAKLDRIWQKVTSEDN